jgi:hypothetical protein
MAFFPSENVAGGALRQPAVRGTFQILMFLVTISPIWLVPTYVRDKAGLFKMVKAYLFSAVVLALIGWLQLSIWIATGSDPFPVGYFNSLLGGMGGERSGLFHYMGSTIYRMSSFAGEPKGLGNGLAVALLLLQAGVKLKGALSRWIWPFLFISMVATFSTSALLGWFGATVVQLFTSSQGKLTLPRLSTDQRLARKIFLWMIPVLFLTAVATHTLPIFEIIEMRTTARVLEGDGGALEDSNVAVLYFLLDHPLWAVTGTGLGNVHLYADSYLPDYAVRYAGDTTFVAKSGALRWISEIGFVTLIVFMVWIISTVNKTCKAGQKQNHHRFLADIIGKVTLPLLALWFVSGYISSQFFMMIGSCVALGLIINKPQPAVATITTPCACEMHPRPTHWRISN